MRIHIFDSTINNVEAWWKIVLPVEYCKKYYTLNIVINFFALCAFCAIWHFQTSYKCIEFRDLLAAYYYIYKKRKKIKEHKNVDFISSQIRQTGVFNNRTGKDIYRAIVILNKIFLRAESFFILQPLAPKSCPLETTLKEIKEVFISLFSLYDDIFYLLLISLVLENS